MASMTSENRKRNEKKRTEQEEAHFVSRVTVTLTREVCVCVTMKKSARRMASTTSDTGDTSSKQQQAQRKENYNKNKRSVLSVDHCNPYRRKKRREAVY